MSKPLTVSSNSHRSEKCKPNTRVFLFLLLFVSSFTHANAQSEIPDTLVKERIEYIQKSLDQGKPGAKLWWNTWLYGYTAATFVQGGIFLSSDELKTRQDMSLGAATTLIGAVGQLVMPMSPVSAPKKLVMIPGETREDRLFKLIKAEELFAASAQREKDGRSWKMHALSGAVNLSSGLVTWIGFDRTIWAGLGNFALNTAICEAQMWTQPTRAMKDYEKYLESYKNGIPYSTLRPKAHIYVSAFPGGLALKLVF